MIRVGVVRGGISNEYDVSLQTGATVLQILREHHLPKYEAVDILITKDGTWHIGGKSITADELKQRVDVVFNALHGEYGEDGQIQTLLEDLGIPYTGSGPVASAIGMNKKLTKDSVSSLGVKTANHYIIKDYRNLHGTVEEVYLKEEAQNVFLSFAPPWVVKPLNSGSSVGVSIARTREELLNAIKTTSRFPGDILVEEFVKGKEATVAVTEQFRGQPVYTFLPVEVRIPDGKIFDYETKYAEQIPTVSPGNFTTFEKEKLQMLAHTIFRQLGLRHYATMDFIVTPKQIYMLEVNTLPGMAKDSLLIKSLPPIGASLPEFIDHVITLALK